MPPDAALLDRVRRLLAGRDGVEERRMVGGRSFGVRGVLACGVNGGGLVVRVGADAVPAAVAEPHVAPLRMGRRTTVAFVVVAPEGCADDDALRRWVERGLAAAVRP